MWKRLKLMKSLMKGIMNYIKKDIGQFKVEYQHNTFIKRGDYNHGKNNRF